MAPCNDAGPAFLLNEIGPTWHPLHITFLLVYSNIYPLKCPKIQLVLKSSLVRPSLIPQILRVLFGMAAALNLKVRLLYHFSSVLVYLHMSRSTTQNGIFGTKVSNQFGAKSEPNKVFVRNHGTLPGMNLSSHLANFDIVYYDFAGQARTEIS